MKSKNNLPEGLIVQTLVEGSGREVKTGQVIKAHYQGSLENGETFDSSYERNQPFIAQIGVGNLIKGWDIAIPGVREGGKIKLTIPPDLAYGDRDLPGIPAGSTLIFELEVLEIMD